MPIFLPFSTLHSQTTKKDYPPPEASLLLYLKSQKQISDLYYKMESNKYSWQHNAVIKSHEDSNNDVSNFLAINY